jgi:hypothetical protein
MKNPVKSYGIFVHYLDRKYLMNLPYPGGMWQDVPEMVLYRTESNRWTAEVDARRFATQEVFDVKIAGESVFLPAHRVLKLTVGEVYENQD